jgi:hypothetical protein
MLAIAKVPCGRRLRFMTLPFALLLALAMVAIVIGVKVVIQMGLPDLKAVRGIACWQRLPVEKATGAQFIWIQNEHP